MIFKITQALLIISLPFFLSKATYKFGTQNWLSPVVLCYIFGIALRNLTPLPLDNGLSTIFIQATILLAIPMLLYSTDLVAWFKLAKATLVSFALVVVSVLVSATINAWLFSGLLDDSWMLSGMLTGVYIGGTPNMNAVGIALEASEATFITINAAEIACGGIYLVFLTSVAHRFFGLFLPDFKEDKHVETDGLEAVGGFKWKDLLQVFGTTALVAGAAIGITKMATGTLEKPGLMVLSISALGIAASFIPKVRQLKGSYQAGEYLLLMFSVAIGLMADFSEIFVSGGTYIAFAGLVLLFAVLFHLALCMLFKIDRDTMMITATAAFYGPPFIGQIASVIKNRSLIFSGIATGLVGIAIANFFGIALANLGNWLNWLN